VKVKQEIRFGMLCVAAAAFVAFGASFVQVQAQSEPEPEPLWAYGWLTQPQPGDTAVPQVNPLPPTTLRGDMTPEDQRRPRTVEGSDATYSWLEIRDGHNVIEWFPEDYPPLTPIMKTGPASLMSERGRGCASCHLPTGKGRPENAPPGGQPAAYTIQQLQDMANDLRYQSDPRDPNTPTMVALAKAMTEEEMRESAEYFEAIPYTKWIEVIEADEIPEMELHEGEMYLAVGGDGKEPLGNRIVETPRDEHQANFLRNTRDAGDWIAYVPVGSLARGEELVTTGGGKTVACMVCHGLDLMGLGAMPGIAGRSPSYQMRQLWDMKMGTRKGPQAALMAPVIANLTVDDMTDIVAYLASIDPPVPQ
jgi:cytochrome c553